MAQWENKRLFRLILAVCLLLGTLPTQRGKSPDLFPKFCLYQHQGIWKRIAFFMKSFHWKVLLWSAVKQVHRVNFLIKEAPDGFFFLLWLKNIGLVEVFPDYLWDDCHYLKSIFHRFCQSFSFVLNFLIRQRFFHFRRYSFDEVQCSQLIQFIRFLIWGKLTFLRVFIFKDFRWA